MAHMEQVLVVVIDDNYYAINSDDVIQILRVPDITSVPLVHESILGICPIEGSIITVLDMRYLLSHEGSFVDSTQEQVRTVTIRYGEITLALMVEEVVSNVYVGDDFIDQKSQQEDDPVIGILKHQDRIVQILSIDKLIRDVTLPEFDMRKTKDNISNKQVSQVDDSEVIKYLFFHMGKEIFAINSDLIREIIFYTDDLTEIAGSSDEILGMITLRNQVIVTVDLRAIFGMAHEVHEECRIMIMHHNNQLLGLLVDDILDIKDISINQHEQIPDNHRRGRFKGVVKLDGNLVSAIDEKVVYEIVENTKHFVDQSSKETPDVLAQSHFDQSKTSEMVFFKLSGEEYAFNINDVDEIIRYTDVTTVPDSPELFRGIINLRGSVIPVVSLHQRLDVVEKIQEDTKILICHIENGKIGFIVDAVSEVIHVPHANMKVSDNSDPLITKVIMLEEGERIVLQIDPSEMIGCPEIRDFSAKLVNQQEIPVESVEE